MFAGARERWGITPVTSLPYVAVYSDVHGQFKFG